MTGFSLDFSFLPSLFFNIFAQFCTFFAIMCILVNFCTFSNCYPLRLGAGVKTESNLQNSEEIWQERSFPNLIIVSGATFDEMIN